MHQANFHNLIALAFLSLLLAGCIFQQSESTPTPLPSIGKPSVSPTASASPSPSPSPSAEPTASIEPTPSQAPSVQCTITAVPDVGTGPFNAVVSALFFNLPDSIVNATIKCNSQDAGVLVERARDSFFRTCRYEAVFTSQESFTASAEISSPKVSCATTIFVNPDSSLQKELSISPSSDSVSLSKSIANSTSRNFTVSNSGNVDLQGFSCSVNKNFANVTFCPTELDAGESHDITVWVNVASLAAGSEQVQVTVTEDDAQEHSSLTVIVSD